MVPKSFMYSTLQTVTNPHAFEMDDIEYVFRGLFIQKRILGTSGQNLTDVFQYVENPSRLDIAERMLEWAHFAPTAPDTLCKFLWERV